MFCLSGKGSIVSCDVFPPYDVSEGEWEMGLVDLSTFNSIPNIEKGKNDKFYYGEGKVITIDEGSYEIEDIETYILKRIDKNVEFSLKANNNTLKAEIYCSEAVDFTKEDSIASILGFDRTRLTAKIAQSSSKPVDIVKVNVIRVECNVVRGSFDNGSEGHTLHEFYPTVAPGYKIVEIPSTIVYLPVNVRRINNITVSLKDQDGNSINLRGETLSVRVHIKRRHGFGI